MYADDSALDQLSFAWAGGMEVGDAHYYRVQSHRVLVEYDNTQRGANHVHTVWRDLTTDFGGDPLAHHYTDEMQYALGQLPDELRETLLLVVVGELTHQEVADMLELPLGTVLSRVSRARRRLREAPEPERILLLARVLREARDTEAWRFTSPAEVIALWPRLSLHLDRGRPRLGG